MINKPFGYSYLLDCYFCKEGTCDSLELHYRFLERLVAVLDMKPLCQPIVLHCPVDFSKTLGGEILATSRFPDKDGVSGWVGLATSGIQIHSIEPSHFMSLDAYSCLEFDKNIVLEEAQKVFGFTEFEENLIKRGIKYY